MQRQSSLGSKPNLARSKAYSNSIHLYLLSLKFPFVLSDDLSELTSFVQVQTRRSSENGS